MTEPTDAELEALLVDKAPILALVGANVRTAVVKAMREAFAKWGTPPAVAGEPVAWQVWWGLGEMRPHWPPFKTQNDAADHASMIRSCTEVRPLYTTPQPTQAQAGAVPMPRRTLLDMTQCYSDRETFGRAVEAWHGIKGGQHGADN